MNKSKQPTRPTVIRVYNSGKPIVVIPMALDMNYSLITKEFPNCDITLLSQGYIAYIPPLKKEQPRVSGKVTKERIIAAIDHTRIEIVAKTKELLVKNKPTQLEEGMKIAYLHALQILTFNLTQQLKEQQ